MITQSGIKSLTFYSALDTTFDYQSKTEITNIAGTSITITSCEQPTLEQTVTNVNRRNLFNYSFSFTLFALEGFNTLETLKKNYVGWYILMERNDGTIYFLNSPSKVQGSALNNESISFACNTDLDRPTKRMLKVN